MFARRNLLFVRKGINVFIGITSIIEEIMIERKLEISKLKIKNPFFNKIK